MCRANQYKVTSMEGKGRAKAKDSPDKGWQLNQKRWEKSKTSVGITQGMEGVRTLYHVRMQTKPVVHSATYQWFERKCKGVTRRNEPGGNGPGEVRTQRTKFMHWDVNPKASKGHKCFQAFGIPTELPNMFVHHYHQNSLIFTFHSRHTEWAF